MKKITKRKCISGAERGDIASEFIRQRYKLKGQHLGVAVLSKFAMFYSL